MRAVFFTDLDGTLLDHESYSYAPARTALDALRTRGIPLVLASSKTAAEMAPLHRELQLGDTPAIVENGAGILDPRAPADENRKAYDKIIAALDSLPPNLRKHYTGFSDMTAEDVARITGLDRGAADLARQRCFSEPGVWDGSHGDREAFLAHLARHGITGRQGGRFLTLSFGRTKADAMNEVALRLGASVTVALGDAPNDMEMLEAADYAVVVRNDHGPDLPELAEEGTSRVRRTALPGPDGWNRAVLDIVEELFEGAAHDGFSSER